MPPVRRVAFMLDLDWPYKRHTGVFAGAQRFAEEAGWETLVDEYADDTLGRRSGGAGPYDGVIARATRKLAVRAGRLGVPVVNVWLSSPAGKVLPGVYPDFAEIGRSCAEHLLDRGLRRFALLTVHPDLGQEIAGRAFVETTRNAGFPCLAARTSLHAVDSVGEWRRKQRGILEWMQGWTVPIGVLAGGESDGRMIAQFCRNRGLRIPDDVAIIAGTNEVTLCERLRPTLTSIEVGYERIGYEAAARLQHLMDGNPPPSGAVLLPPTGLVVRESTDFLTTGDPLIAAALRFISANSRSDIGPDEVARAVAAEPRTLQRHFRRHLSRSVAAEVRRVRIERAKRELAGGDAPIAEVARLAGFGNPARMRDVFRRELGISPAEYRSQRRAPG